MKISYRTAIPEDALCLGVLGTQIFLDTYAKQGIRPSVAREVLEHFSVEAISDLLSSPSTAFLVAEQDGHLIALAQLTHGSTHELVPFEPAMEVKRLYVQEHFTGKGVGQTLLRHAEALAAARGARALWLTAWVGNPRALAFYERQGYRDVGGSTYVYENDVYETRVFVRELA